MKPIGIVVGLAAEARVAQAWGVPVTVGGGAAAGAARAARSLAPLVSGLVSFGLAGGLDPALRAGDLIVPDRVLDDDGSWESDPGLNRMLGGSTGHNLLGGGAVLATTQAKDKAWKHGAHAVDLESAAVARAASQHDLPFAVLRAICDEAGRALPLAALVALSETGRIGIAQVLFAVLRRPWEVPELVALGRDAAKGRAALLDRVRTTRVLCHPA